MQLADIYLHTGDFMLIADGSKAILLVNRGDGLEPHLSMERSLSEEHPGTAELGTDRPGHFNKGSRSRRGAFDITDFHDAAEDEFAKRVMGMLENALTEARMPRVVITAPPRMLGYLRGHMTPAVQGRVAAEFDRDLTHLSPWKIEALLANP